MPNLEFYAVDDDWSAVLATVFDLGLFRVFESDSEPDSELREFHAPEDVPADRQGWHLALLVIGAGPEPVMRRIDFLPGVHPTATFKYTCDGWGLIRLDYGGLWRTQQLLRSRTNHNTEKRALGWAAATPRLGDPAAWDWPTITRASSRLNRAVRRLGVRKIGSDPVLPQADRFIAEAGFQHVYGNGIHATRPSLGMRNGG